MDSINDYPKNVIEPTNVILRRRNPDGSVNKLNRPLLYEFIKENQPISIYEIAKKTGFAYTTIRDAVKLIAVGETITFKTIVRDNRAIKNIIINTKMGGNEVVQ
ncbi:hypothetical protein GOV12_07030 [Candidatus Pacearchaeota archaeon]|nr:hypothetical protein [Candidatus Pacearchaeota archaeon]